MPITPSDGVPSVPYAELYIASEVDMGTFEGDTVKKSVDITMINTGTDTLFVRNALPECSCTELFIRDSILLPGDSGIITATLDVNGYPSDSVRREFGILSNDRRERVKRVALIGVRK